MPLRRATSPCGAGLPLSGDAAPAMAAAWGGDPFVARNRPPGWEEGAAARLGGWAFPAAFPTEASKAVVLLPGELRRDIHPHTSTTPMPPATTNTDGKLEGRAWRFI